MNKLTIITLIMTVLALASAVDVCPIFKCETTDATTRCARKDGNNIYLYKCKSDWYCDDAIDLIGSSSTSNGLCKQKYGFTDKGQDGWCYNDGDCESGNCEVNTCKFKTLGQSCSRYSTNCGAGLKCQLSGSSYVCQKIFAQGEACTEATAQQCHSVCARKAGEGSYTCMAPFSVADDTVLEFASVYDSGKGGLLCSSMGFDQTTKKCAQPDVIENFPKVCTANADCASKAGKSGKCACTHYNKEGKALCEPTNDQKMVQYAKQAKSWYEKDMSSCTEYDQKNSKSSCHPGVDTDDLETIIDWSDGANLIKEDCYSGAGFKNKYSAFSYWSTAPTSGCNKYVCGVLTEGICRQYASATKTYTLQACPSNDFYCSYKSSTEYKCRRYVDGKIDDICYDDDDCYSDKCINNKCAIVQVGGTCSKDINCDKGSTCYNKVCVAYKDIGEVCANSDQAVPSGLCATYTVKGASTATQPKVVKLFSLDDETVVNSVLRNGETYTAYNSYFNQLCNSGYYNSTLNKCGIRKTTNGQWPKECTLNSDCATNIGDDTDCECYPNTDGKKFCEGTTYEKLKVSDYLNKRYFINWMGCYPYEIEKVKGSSCYNDNVDDDDYKNNPVASAFRLSCFNDILIENRGDSSSVSSGSSDAKILTIAFSILVLLAALFI